MAQALHVVHQLPGRVRLRASGAALTAKDLSRLTEAIARVPGVIACVGRLVTGSLIVEHDGDFSAVADQAAAQGLFELAEAPEPKPVGLIAEEGLTYADLRLRELSNGQFDLRSTLGTLLIGLAVLQLARGQIVGPAMTLLLQSLDLLTRSR